ncbi:MAG: hypothetical protein EAZ44_04145 [Cytophagia bacterium]|nr:MAG: hypothetical protein EAZ44_04145 [Cytophagia bacterium]TAG42623.1 MAG: hypothetical protein EAZ31_05765 [Cytophagia bacterium]
MFQIIQKNIGLQNKYAFPSCFFLQEEKHILYQNKENIGEYFCFLWIKDDKIQCFLGGILADSIFYSPFRATFGSFCVDENMNDTDFLLFVESIKIFLSSKNTKKIHLKNFPFCYDDKNATLIENILIKSKFEIQNNELNFHLELSENNVDFFHSSEKRRYQKCLKNDFIFQKENQNIDLSFVHSFIKKSRERKNYPMTLIEKDFINLVENFPEEIEIFTVKKEDVIAALCVTVRMNEKILYSFYPADNIDFLTFSPLVFLFAQLTKYAFENNYQILDLGIATDKSIVNEGLSIFKQRLGGKVTPKNEWIYHF